MEGPDPPHSLNVNVAHSTENRSDLSDNAPYVSKAKGSHFVPIARSRKWVSFLRSAFVAATRSRLAALYQGRHTFLVAEQEAERRREEEAKNAPAVIAAAVAASEGGSAETKVGEEDADDLTIVHVVDLTEDVDASFVNDREEMDRFSKKV